MKWLWLDITGIFRGFSNQFSWSRICSAVALYQACKLSAGAQPNLYLVLVWLGVATGTLSATKVVEAIIARTVSGSSDTSQEASEAQK